jgi:hypothetical protein
MSNPYTMYMFIDKLMYTVPFRDTYMIETHCGEFTIVRRTDRRRMAIGTCNDERPDMCQVTMDGFIIYCNTAAEVMALMPVR